MKKLLLVLCLNVSTAWACRCNPELNNSMLARPDSAPHSFVGTVVRREARLGIKVESLWTIAKDYYDLDDISSCRVRLPEGERYLVLATSSERLHRCSTVFVPIADADALMQKLSAKEGIQGALNPLWSYCKKDDDCVLSPDPCKNHFGVSAQYLAAFEKFSREAKWECPAPAVAFKASAVCRKNNCSPKPD